MKNLLLLVLFGLSIHVTSFAQHQNFPKKQVEILLNKELVVKNSDEVTKEYGYPCFFSNEDLTSIYKKGKLYSKYDKLVGKHFIVKQVDKIDGGYRLKLSNEDIGDIYYKYDIDEDLILTKMNFNFEVIGGLENTPNFYRNDIVMNVDKFTNDTTFYSPEVNGISVRKYKNNIFLSLELSNDDLGLDGKGCILLLTNGKIDMPDIKINVEVSKNIYAAKYNRSYIHTATILLSDELVKKLSSEYITDYRLYIYDNSVFGNKTIDGKTISEYIKCMSEK